MKGTSWGSVGFLASHCGRIYRQTSRGMWEWIWLLRKYLRTGNFETFFPQNRRGSGARCEARYSRQGSRRKKSNDDWGSSFAVNRPTAHSTGAERPGLPRYDAEAASQFGRNGWERWAGGSSR